MLNHITLKLELDVDGGANVHPNPDTFVHTYEGGIWAFPDAEADDQVKVGEVVFFVVDLLSAEDHGHSLIDVHDNVACDFFELIETNGYREYRAEVARACGGELWMPNALLIDRVVVHPAFRGNGVGAAAIDMIVRRFGHGCSFAALRAVPLQHGNPSPDEREAWKLDDLPQDKAQSQQALFRIYEKAGFARLPGLPDMMIRPTPWSEVLSGR